ncbi:hypothetical protein [Paracidovorax anthurii]|uniref:hypothetical protein n=1 Tax=Paracidovorax anthurii TaxID=78229 RepID=UPI0039F079CD
MAFSITGHVTVEYVMPAEEKEEKEEKVVVQKTFYGHDFHLEEGGNYKDDEGGVYHSAIWIAFGEEEVAVEVSVHAYRVGACRQFEVRPRNCKIIEDELDYTFTGNEDPEED